jgi:DNA-binding transcriptional MerR regulator
MNAFTIRDLEQLTGVKAHTIRIWEQRYSFLKPKRTETNIRYYSNEELKTVLNISLLNKYGFKISHIDRMPQAEISERILSLSDARAIQERLINELVQHMADLDMVGFEKVLNDHISEKGIERTVIQVLFPFLEKTGILWQAGMINAAQEHLVTNIIRQKLIVGIESCISHVRVDKTFLLFLPEGEHHELGLLFMYYLIQSRGAKAIYLGANVPINDAAYVMRVKKCDVAYIHLTSRGELCDLDKFILQVEKQFDSGQVIISGHCTQHIRPHLSKRIHLKKSLAEVMEYLASLGAV